MLIEIVEFYFHLMQENNLLSVARRHGLVDLIPQNEAPFAVLVYGQNLLDMKEE